MVTNDTIYNDRWNKNCKNVNISIADSGYPTYVRISLVFIKLILEFSLPSSVLFGKIIFAVKQTDLAKSIFDFK